MHLKLYLSVLSYLRPYLSLSYSLMLLGTSYPGHGNLKTVTLQVLLFTV